MEAVEEARGAGLDVVVEVEDGALFLVTWGHAYGVRRRFGFIGFGFVFWFGFVTRGRRLRGESHYGGVLVGGPLLAAGVAEDVGDG